MSNTTKSEGSATVVLVRGGMRRLSLSHPAVVDAHGVAFVRNPQTGRMERLSPRAAAFARLLSLAERYGRPGFVFEGAWWNL